MKILVIDFSGEAIIQQLIPPGHEVVVEQKDGQNAYRISGEWIPDMILVNGQAKHSHNRQTILAIQRRKKSSQIPIFIVTGQKADCEYSNEMGICILPKNIDRVVKQIGKK